MENIQDRVQQLKVHIQRTLTPLITHNYRYLMMCDHQNVGDTLIMKGEFDFLSTIKTAKCKEYTTMWSFEKRRPVIPKEDLLIMRGSGSFGDIWPTAPNFWKFVMENYPENPILFMPQTIHFKEKTKLIEMAHQINNHKKVVLCLRDKESYDIAKTHFRCDIFLVPDMAFYMNVNNKKNSYSAASKTLIVKREDKECRNSNLISTFSNKDYTSISDWPTFKTFGITERVKQRLYAKNHFKLYDEFVKVVYSSYIVKQGLNFINPFAKVYATRMHAGILAMMLGKEVVFVDNNYGKLRKVYETWLNDVKNVYLEVQ